MQPAGKQHARGEKVPAVGGTGLVERGGGIGVTLAPYQKRRVIARNARCRRVLPQRPAEGGFGLVVAPRVRETNRVRRFEHRLRDAELREKRFEYRKRVVVPVLTKEVPRKIREQRVRGLAETGNRAPQARFDQFELSGFRPLESVAGGAHRL